MAAVTCEFHTPLLEIGVQLKKRTMLTVIVWQLGRWLWWIRATHVNVKKQTNLKLVNSYLEVDAWIPTLNICFEFQDVHHYAPTWYFHNAQSEKELARKEDLTLVEVPCWWDGELESLKETIYCHRPDLLVSSFSAPISLNPKSGFFPENAIPDVGELMLASFPLQPKFIIPIAENNQWWVGEKYDGIRCCWNPLQQRRELPLLPSLITQFPTSFIDGEIWFGRGLYTHTYMFFNGVTESVRWDLLKLMAFDNPDMFTRSLTFEKRYETLLNIAEDHTTIMVAFRVKCRDDIHLNTYLKNIIEFGGEGAILRKTESIYESGRTSSLIKLKSTHGDQEGIVVGKGDNKSVVIKHPNGTTFTVPNSSIHLSSPLTVGDIVSFSSDKLARREAPANPHIFRVRTDLSWNDVVFNFFNDKKTLADHLQLSGFTSQPVRYWTLKNMRSFLENFAKSRNLDPLLPETWYSLPYEYISHLKNGNAILRKFKGHINALHHLFPDVNFDINAFPRGSWSSITNRKKFFEKYAETNTFDPLIPENWYFQPTDRMMATKGALSVCYHHNGSLSQALLDLFPNIGLDESKLWISLRDRKKFFEEYATTNGFDPLVPENWYTQSKEKIMREGKFMINNYYNGSASKALIDVFPNVGFQKVKFWPKPLWQDVRNRRKWFENFASENKFDPLVASNWYNQSRDHLLSSKGLSGIIAYHNQSITQALIDLFPNIGLEKSKMWKKKEWEDAAKRREFFRNYAKENGFTFSDCNSWYSQSAENIKAAKGGSGVLSYHKNNFPKALMDLFPEIGLEKSRFSPHSSLVSIKNRRNFFEILAENEGFDPLVADNWYHVSLDTIMATKGAKQVLSYHQNNVPQALVDLFSTIGLDKRKFSASSLFWKNVDNRKKFFENYSTQQGFDARDPGQWYLQPADRILSTKGASKVISYHNNSIPQALLDLFPDIGLDLVRFRVQPRWNDENNRREFFLNYAKANNFDPLVPDNWYRQSRANIMDTKGASRVIHYHNHSIPQALISLFPDIGLQKSKFWIKRMELQLKENRRKFFENYAKENNFNPLVADNWYNQTKEKIQQNKGAARVLIHHNNSLPQALCDLFPEIGLQRSLFRRIR